MRLIRGRVDEMLVFNPTCLLSATHIRLCLDTGGRGRIHLEQRQLPLCSALFCEPIRDAGDSSGVGTGHGAVVLDSGASYPRTLQADNRWGGLIPSSSFCLDAPRPALSRWQQALALRRL